MSIISPPHVDDSLELDALPSSPSAPRRPRSRVERVWRGPDSDPAWVRPALLLLLATTAALYLWNLGASGWANTYYSAAVQAGTKSWKAFFFGSTDSSNFVTVDKTPASLWVMEISGRHLRRELMEHPCSASARRRRRGRHLVRDRQALVLAGRRADRGRGVRAHSHCRVDVPFQQPRLAARVAARRGRRTRSPARSRTGARAGSSRPVRSSGSASSPKELQAFLVLPAFGLVYLFAGPPRLARRFGQVVLLGVTTLAAGGWWVAIVQLWPASSRPYIGGSQNNSFWNVLFGYNGFGRLDRERIGQRRRSAGRRGRRTAVGSDGSDADVQRAIRRADLVVASRPRCSSWSEGSRSRRRVLAPIARAPRSGSGAGGYW